MKNILLTLILFFGITSSVNAEEFFNEESTIRIYFCDFDGLDVKVIWDENYDNAVFSSLVSSSVRRGIISYEFNQQSIQETLFVTQGIEDSMTLIGFYILKTRGSKEVNTILSQTWGDREATLTINDGVFGTISRKGNCLIQ